MKKSRSIFLGFVSVLLIASFTAAQEPVHWDVVSKIREEGFQRSQVMDIVGYMTDVIGPRLSGSPNMKNGQQWAKTKMESIGLVNTAIEPYGEHGVNWDNTYTSLHMIEPDYQPLFGYPLAFTRGTDGKITSNAVFVEIRTRDDFEKYRGKLNNAVVLTAPLLNVGPSFVPDAVRRSKEDLERMSQAIVGQSGRGGRGGGRGRGGIPTDLPPDVARRVGQLQQEISSLTRSVSPDELNEFFKSEGVAVLMQPGRGGDGTVFVGGRPGSRGDRSYDAAMNSLPMVSIAAEHYNRIYRILQRGIPVELEIEIRNTLDNSDTREFNVVGEIPGTDPALRNELVMVGGHYDSWHTGTGATDNAAGCAVAMEAMRILKAIGVQPRRTIRIALWSYEEGGLNGSREYVAAHFGNPDDGIKPDYDKFAGYFNMDNGTGQFRGVYLQGNEHVRPIFTEWMKPFHDLGMNTLTIRNTGGTDHLSFDRAGLPGFQFIQDGIDYNTRTHHSNMDVYDSLVPEDLMKNAVIMASFIYHAAQRDEKLPRKSIR